jgi:hypothetical protein
MATLLLASVSPDPAKPPTLPPRVYFVGPTGQFNRQGPLLLQLANTAAQISAESHLANPISPPS